MPNENKKPEVPIAQKLNLTIPEASALFGIGEKKLYALTNDESCKFVLFVGNKRLIKRKPFEAFISTAYSI